MKKVRYFMYPTCCGTAMSLPVIIPLKEAKVWASDWLGVNRLPNGTEFWDGNDFWL